MKLKNTITIMALISAIFAQNSLAMEKNYFSNQRGDINQQQRQSEAQNYVAYIEKQKLEEQERHRKEAQNYHAQLEREKLEKQERDQLKRQRNQEYFAHFEREKLEKLERNQKKAQAAACLYENIQKSKKDNPPQENDEELKRQDHEDLEVILGLSTQEDVDRARLLRQKETLNQQDTQQKEIKDQPLEEFATSGDAIKAGEILVKNGGNNNQYNNLDILMQNGYTREKAIIALKGLELWYDED